MEKIIKKWWNQSSAYYQKKFDIPVDDIYYWPFCPSEKELNIMDVNNIKGKKVLELGCGGGQCSIFLSKKGAICKGVDISKKQISFAKKLAKKNYAEVEYFEGSGENLDMFEDNHFDIVLSVFSIQ